MNEKEDLNRVASAQQDAVPPHERQLLYRGGVIVGQDGNGATAESFATTVGGDQVRYILIVAEAVCPDQSLPCPPPVDSVTITLNGETVLQTNVEFDRDRVQVPLIPTGGELNRIIITAVGEAGAAARVAVHAVRPADVFFVGLSVLPWALANDRVRTFLAVHNAGAGEIGLRIAFFEPDGSVAGRSAPRRLGRHATVNLNLSEVAASLERPWTRGAVHVEWAARGLSRVSTVAGEEHGGPNPDESLPVNGIRTLALDDYPPRPLTAAAAEEFFGN